MDPVTRKKGQGPIVGGIVAVGAAAILGWLHLDFLSGVAAGTSLAAFVLGFRAFNHT